MFSNKLFKLGLGLKQSLLKFLVCCFKLLYPIFAINSVKLKL